MRIWLACLAFALGISGLSLAETEAKATLLPVEQFQDWYYENPSSIQEIGDPHIFEGEGAYWCVATSSAVGYRIWKSLDLVNWERQEEYAYQKKSASWSRGNFWAPEIYPFQGKYYLFYSARCKGKWDSMRIGVAVADHPQGPYLDTTAEPLFDPGYSVIDASFFADEDGGLYLYYARDCSENVVEGRHESHIYGVRLKADFTGILGEPVVLTQPDQAWEKDSGPDWFWNEGAVVRKHEGKYWLFYSANFYASKEYGVGVASADSPLGPFQKADSNPMMQYVEREGRTVISGPGHNSFVTIGSEDFIVYHTHTDANLAGDDRQMALDRTGFHGDGTPFVNGPTLFPQLKPLSLLGLENRLPSASVTSGTPEGLEYLSDGDFGIAPGSQAYCWQPAGAQTAWVEYRWEQPVEASAILLYPRSGATGTGRILLDGEAIPLDWGQAEDAPGACLRLHLKSATWSTLRLELNAPVAEVLFLGRAEK